MVSCLQASRLFGGSKMPRTGPFWAEACEDTSDVLNMMQGSGTSRKCSVVYRRACRESNFAGFLFVIFERARWRHCEWLLYSSVLLNTSTWRWEPPGDHC